MSCTLLLTLLGAAIVFAIVCAVILRNKKEPSKDEKYNPYNYPPLDRKISNTTGRPKVTRYYPDRTYTS